MICISVTPKSRQLALVDILNASRQCDIVEVCLDHLVKEPDFKELLQIQSKPILFSCRRPSDGGQWTGTEEDRILLLKQAILAGPAWIELEIDIASQIPRFGKTKRLISFTKLDKPLGELDAVLDRAELCQADAVKFVGPTPTLDAAWPLLVAVTKKREMPVCGFGIGKQGLTFQLLARKYDSPWLYAALEEGMEAYQGQATVGTLDEIYQWRSIHRGTRFIGVAGFNDTQELVVRILNVAFRVLGEEIRCLPLELDQLDRFGQMFDILKINSVILDSKHGGRILSAVSSAEDAVKQSQYADFLIKTDRGWQAYNTLWRGALKALTTTLGPSDQPDRSPLSRTNVMILGSGPVARAIAFAIRPQTGLLSVVGADAERAQLMAQMFDCRHVPLAQIYDTLCDVLIITDGALEKGHQKGQLNPSFFRPGMTVLDLTKLPDETDLLIEARERGAKIVDPSAIFLDQLQAQFHSITGREIPPEAVSKALISF